MPPLSAPWPLLPFKTPRLSARFGHLRLALALALDQLLDPIDDIQKALRVDSPHVAGVQPTLGVDHVRCRVGPVEVALHYLRTAHPYFADLARLGIQSAGEVENARLCVGCADPNRSQLERRASGR